MVCGTSYITTFNYFVLRFKVILSIRTRVFFGFFFSLRV